MLSNVSAKIRNRKLLREKKGKRKAWQAGWWSSIEEDGKRTKLLKHSSDNE